MLALLFIFACPFFQPGEIESAEESSSSSVVSDTTFRIVNLNPYFILQADSTVTYNLRLNRKPENYYWYLRNNPLGVRIDANTGILYFKAESSYFKSGNLYYDQEYKVEVGVQNLLNPHERTDTSFIIVFYNTESSLSKIHSSVSKTLFAEEGDSVHFKIQCDNRFIPVQHIAFTTNIPISNYTPIYSCNDEFRWLVPFDFIKDNDSVDEREMMIQFVSTDKLFNKDTVDVSIIVRPGVNYPLQNQEHKKIADEVGKYIQNLKLTFYVINKNVRVNKITRTVFDITSSVTALAATLVPVPNSEEDASKQNLLKILPGLGLTLIPVKETLAPDKVQEKANANQVRAIAKKLEYVLNANMLVGNKDPDILDKTKNLQEEMKQCRLQLMELPLMEFDEKLTVQDAEKYFKDYKTQKRYKLKMN